MKKSPAQSITEYTILLGIVAAAIMSMNVYLKRGVQAGIKLSVDQFSNQKDGMVSEDFKKTQAEKVIFSNSLTHQNSTMTAQTIGNQLTNTFNQAVSTKSSSQSQSIITDN